MSNLVRWAICLLAGHQPSSTRYAVHKGVLTGPVCTTCGKHLPKSTTPVRKDH